MSSRTLWAVVFLLSACQRSEAAIEPGPAPRAAVSKRSEVVTVARYDSPQEVYKRYAETLGASQWAEAIALFTPSGKAELVVSNFKGLALLPGSPHPKKHEFKAVLLEFCRGHRLRCADEGWNERFAPTLLAGANATAMLSDLTRLAKAEPEATYVELMKLVSGVDQGSVLPLDPTLTDVRYTGDTATGIARRADGETTTMSFENSSERGWAIVE